MWVLKFLNTLADKKCNIMLSIAEYSLKQISFNLDEIFALDHISDHQIMLNSRVVGAVYFNIFYGEKFSWWKIDWLVTRWFGIT